MNAQVEERFATLLVQILGALRTLEIHGPNNEAVKTTTERMAATINALVAHRSELRVQLVDRFILVDNEPIRGRNLTPEHLEALRAAFAARRLGGIIFTRAVDAEAIREWLVALADENGNRRLRELQVLGIRAIEAQTIGLVDYRNALDMTTLSYAKQTFARAVVGASLFIDAVKLGKNPFVSRINIVRVVQDLIDISRDHPHLLLEALQARRENSPAIDEVYGALHAASTCCYAILIGQVLNLDRMALLDVGTCGFLADIPHAIAPEALTEKAGKLSDSEYEEVRRAMIRGVQSLMTKGIGDATLKRISVSYEHHDSSVDADSGKRTDLHPYSRIVAVADAFDAMTTARSWRPAMPARGALAQLRLEADKKFDASVITALESVIVRRSDRAA